jgi:DNA repair exonuclease SbcCD ATPase subunit
MIFRSLAIQYFRSFKNDQVLHFGTNPAGFYLIRGENGAGKSSIWDAVCWVLYEKTARGLKAGNVANWERDGLTSVCFEFDKDGHEYAVTRTWDPNSLTLVTDRVNPKTITNKELEQLVGMDYPTFLNVVLMGQFNPYFFDLGEAEKLKVFSDALDLDYWVNRSKATSKLAVKSGELVASREKQLAELEEREKTLTEQLREAWQAEKIWQDEQAQRKEQVHQEREAGLADLVKKQKVLEDWKLYTDKVQEQVNHWKEGIRALQNAANEFLPEISDLKAEIRAQQRVLDRLVLEQATPVQSNAVCRVCGQALPQAQPDANKRDVAKDIAAAQEAIASFQAKLKAAEAEQQNFIQRLPDKQQILKQYEADYAKANHSSLLANADLARSETRLEQLNQKLAELVESKNPHTPRVSKLGDQVNQLGKDIEEHGTRLAETRVEHSDLNFWTKKFKEIRLWLIEEALRELEIESNNCLLQLGLKDWRIALDVEREKSDGGISAGFNVFIYPPGFTEPVPWKAWSGGETQRLRIAGAVGLAQLIKGRKGITSSLEVWDEPTGFMDAEGISDLLTFFDARSREANRQIWWMDHRSLNAGVFDGEIHVTKEGTGSKITDLR